MLFRTIAVSLFLGVAVFQVEGATFYVAPNGGQAAPFASWGSAARVIQDAVDAAVDGDEIVVTNGIYATGGRAVGTNTFVNRVAVDKAVILRSINGAQFTIIDGLKSVRGVSLGSNAVLSGFTVTNGLVKSGGAGVWCEDVSSVVSNCTMSGNLASNNFGGGVCGGTIVNCMLVGNTASYGGGACYGNFNNCIFSGNTASMGGGAYGGTLNNCALTKNSAPTGGGATGSTLNNCTLTQNSGSLGGGVSGGTLRNCIIYYNIGPGGNYDSGSTLNYCCTTPMPPSGNNNISIDPQLASTWHLSANSPCIGAGSYVSVSGTDIDGEPWANPASIGCDESWSGSVTGALSAAITVSYTNVAVGFSVSFEAAINGRVNSSSWDFGDGVVVSNRPYVSHAWANAGDYLTVLRAYNNDNQGGISATVMVHVIAQPVYYVARSNSTPAAPYSSWTSAATNIQNAIDAATVPGALVLVNDGIYQVGIRTVYGMSNRVAITKPITVRSVNGPGATRIVGYQVPVSTNDTAAVRCVYLTNGAVLSGFTLTNGATQISGDQFKQMCGGAVYCEPGGAVVTNCVLTGNSATSQGGGACFGTLINCTLTGNNASWGGGAYNSSLIKCTLRGNSASYGGGVYYGTLDNCLLTNNIAVSGGGAYYGVLNNCLVISNRASGYSPYGGGAYYGTLTGCTIAGNAAIGSWPYAGGMYSASLNNSILYFNWATNGANYDPSGHNSFSYCCTTPDPGGIGILTNAPQFVNYAAGNLRLQTNSLCINSGNNGLVSGSQDMDGNPRVNSGAVDMGAYEFQGTGSAISYAWLQQYGLPADGSADFSDADGDGLNNWQEWIAGTNPTNALSVFKIASANKVNNPEGMVVTWESITTRTYDLQRSTNLGDSPPFITMQTSIPGQPGTTSFTDTNAVGPGPFYYRLSVKQP
jgi:hypothetical protein